MIAPYKNPPVRWSDFRGALPCGVAAVDLRSGRVVGLLEFHTAVEEIFDVQLLVGVRFPEVIGFQQETLSHTFVVPDAGSPAPGGPESSPDSPPDSRRASWGSGAGP